MSAPAPAAIWIDELAKALGVDRRAAERFARRLPAGYQQQVDPKQAARDAANLDALARADGGAAGTLGPQRFTVSTGGESDGIHTEVRLRRYGAVAVELSAFLPVLESFGLVVVEAVPMAIAAGGGSPEAHIDDFRLRWPAGCPFADADGARLVEAIDAVAAGDNELDSLNRLVLAAGLGWVQVRLLR